MVAALGVVLVGHAADSLILQGRQDYQTAAWASVQQRRIDRILRIVAGLVLLGLTLTGYIGVWGWIGVVPLATGALGWCPLYSLLGLNTCPMKSKA